MSNSLQEVASALSTPDPVDRVGRVLTHVMDQARADAGAVVVVGDDSSGRILVARELCLERCDAVAALWKKSQKNLAAGQVTSVGRERMMPLVDGGRAIGGVFLASDRPVDAKRLMRHLTVLARAVRVAIDPDAAAQIGADLLGLGIEESKREITLATLKQHEWNISRVARELGLTRRTIYLRLSRWGVDREKIVKTPRRFALQG